MKEQKEFPTYEEFTKWLQISGFGGRNAHVATEMHNYFRDRVRTVMPEVGQEYEGIGLATGVLWRGKLDHFVIAGIKCKSIRLTPTRDDVIKKAKALGLSDAEIEVLGGAE